MAEDDIHVAPPSSRSRRYRKFALHWLDNGDAAAAAIAAGYAPASAERRGRELLQRHEVITLLEELQGDGFAEQALSVSKRESCGQPGDEHGPVSSGTTSTVSELPSVVSPVLSSTMSATGPEDMPEELGADVAFTSDKVLDELAAVAFASLTDVCMWEGNTLVLKDSVVLAPAHAAAVAEITETSTSKGGTLRVKMHSKMKALDMLCRALGLFDAKSGGAKKECDVAAGEAAGDALHSASALPPEILERIEELYTARAVRYESDADERDCQLQ